MTLPIQIPSASYVGDGFNDTFTFDFRILENNDLKVELDGLEQTESVDYTIENLTELGGDVVFTVVPPNNSIIGITRLTDQNQTTVYTPFDPFPAETHELALDKLTMIVQELEEKIAAPAELSAFTQRAEDETITGSWTFDLPINGTTTGNLVSSDLAGFARNAVAEIITAQWSFTVPPIINGLLWPSNLGTNGQVLTTDGANEMRWSTPSGGGGGGLDPLADETITGSWTFTGTLVMAASLRLGNGQILVGRNAANDADHPLAFVNGSDIAVFGSENINSTWNALSIGGFSIGGALIAEMRSTGLTLQNGKELRSRNAADDGDISIAAVSGGDVVLIGDETADMILDVDTVGVLRAGGIIVGQIEPLANGGLTVRDLADNSQKVGYRNPRDISIANGEQFTQAMEGHIAAYTGATTGQELFVEQLEQFTTLTLDHDGSDLVTLREGAGVTIRWRDGGGIVKTGDRAIAPESIVQLRWKTSTLVTIWGNGIV